MVNPIYGYGVKMTPDINPLYGSGVKKTPVISPMCDGLERSCPWDFKNVSYVDIGLV